MAQRELTDARSVVVVEREPWNINSIKLFCREAGKDFVAILRDSSWKSLPCKSKLACRDLTILLFGLIPFWRRVRVSDVDGAKDVRHPPQFWNNLFQEFHLFGEQPQISNSCNVPFRLCEAGYEADPHGVPCAKHD